MYCRYCGRTNPDGVAKCTHCGAVMTGTGAVYVPQPTPLGFTQGGSKPYNYLVPAILVTLFCCIPLGVASIVFAAQVDSKWNGGDYVGATQSADRAKLFFWLSLVLGFIVIVLYSILVVSMELR